MIQIIKYIIQKKRYFLIPIFLMLLLTSFVVASNIDNGMIMYLNMSDGGVDSTGMNNMTSTTSIDFDTGFNGETSAYCDSSGDQMRNSSVGVNLPFNSTTTGLTMCIQVNSSSSSAYQRMLILSGGGNVNYAFHFRSDPTSALQLWVSGFGTERITKSNISQNSKYFQALCGVVNSTGQYTYVNGYFYNSTPPTGGSMSPNNIFICKDYFGTEQFIGMIDEVAIWNRTLSESEIFDYYNFTNSGLHYPFSAGLPVVNPSYSVSLDESYDINVSSVNPFNLTAYISSDDETLGNASNNSQGFTEVYYALHTDLNSCAIFYQSECIQESDEYLMKNMTKIDNTTFYSTFYDTDLFPAYYPFDVDYIRDNAGDNYSIDLNNFVKFNIFNFSTSAEEYLITIEFDAINTTGGQTLNIWYCNSSYTSGLASSSSNCELADAYNGLGTKHFHPPFSNHVAIPFEIQNVSKTQLSYIVFSTQSNPVNPWKMRYVENTSYDDTSFSLGKTSWTNSSYIFDVHVHSFLDTDYFTAYAKYFDNQGQSNISNTITDYYDYIPQPPSATIFIIPNCSDTSSYTYTITNETNTTINLAWKPSFDVNNETIYYSVYAFISESYPITLVSNTTNTSINVSLNNNFIDSGEYYLKIESCDSNGDCDFGISSCQIDLCENAWYSVLTACINDVRLINYSDISGCSEQYNQPSDFGGYESCKSPPQRIDFNINPELYFHIIMIFLILLFLRVGIMSEGKFKGLLGISGVLFIIYGVIFRIFIFNNIDLSETYYLMTSIISGLFILIGVILTIIGIVEILRNK